MSWNTLLDGEPMGDKTKKRLSDEELQQLINSDPKFRELVEIYRKKKIEYIKRADNAKSPEECHALMHEYVTVLLPEMKSKHPRLIEATRREGVEFGEALNYKLEEFGEPGWRR